MTATATASPTDDIIEVQGLRKRYAPDAPEAVQGIDFAVRRGEVFGLLGPNGAGKTTTIGVITTRVIASEGSVHVDGIDVTNDPVAARMRIAVVPPAPEPRPHAQRDREPDVPRGLLRRRARASASRAPAS